MCGITGFFGAGTRTDLARMTDALAHRGPNGSGSYVDADVPAFLGHRRLAIVDLGGGDQPMWNEDGQVGVVFNGEIYNHLELRARLEQMGHRFRSDHSDTEVLVHGYEEWGADLPIKLNGMFAFAIIDRRRNCFFLARDRFGEKPLMYHASRDLFAFSSELMSLVQHSGAPRSLDVLSMQKFFAYGFVPAPRTMIENVRKLPGGHSLSYDFATHAVTIKRYWRFSIEPDDTWNDRPEADLVEECGALLAQAARRRMMGDVPFGVFLSGGLDSSLVAASLAQTVSASALSTYTIGFDEPSFDESLFARDVATFLHTPHHVRDLKLQTARDLLQPLLGRLDEPLGDASFLPTYMLCAFARESVTFALTGDGGDELFAGYDPMVALAPAAMYRRLMPAIGHKSVVRLADLLPISHTNMSFDFKLRRMLSGMTYPENIQVPVWMAPVSPTQMKDLFEQPLDPAGLYSEAIELWDGAGKKDRVDRTLEYFTTFYLQDDILVKVDRAAMLNSLETRAVFLDNDLVEFSRRLPNRMKFRNGTRKYLLKKVAEKWLPKAIVERKKKGFGIPLAKWLREIPATCPLTPVPGLRLPFVRHAFDAHRSGSADHRLFLWSWLALQSFVSRL